MSYDVAVVGLGGIGSAILAQCAARGAAVIGVEQYGKAHDLGSSHGRSRMIRKAYFEDSSYVPLLQRTYELWRKLEAATGEEILNPTGVLTVGAATGELIPGTRRAAVEHNLALDSLSSREVRARYPMVAMLPGEEAVFEKEAGVLDPERAIHAHLRVARADGAEMHFEVAMKNWRPTDAGFEIFLADGKRITARTLVLSLGPWFKETLETLGVPIRIQRNVQAWFSPETKAFDAPGFPAFLVERDSLPAPLYGFPDSGFGVKAAFHGGGQDVVDVQHLDREVHAASDIEPLMRAMEQWMPGAAKTLRSAAACMYTLTPDEHFVIDRHPTLANLILCGGFSGHGFKFAPVVGEIAADLALGGGTRHQIDFLSLRRFRNGSS